MSYTYGYARVSTNTQILDRQVDALAPHKCDEIFMEKISGTKANRPELCRLKEKVRDGDTVVVESWSRLGRSLADLLELLQWFETKGVQVVSIKENYDTSTPQGRFILTIFQAMAEFERELIVQRVREGVTSARARGRVGGRPKKESGKVETAIKLYHSGEYSISAIVQMTGVSQATIYRYLQKEKAAGAEVGGNENKGDAF